MPPQLVDATPSELNVLCKGGVYDRTEAKGLSAEQNAELWKRWKAGQSLHEIGRAPGKDYVVIHFAEGELTPLECIKAPDVIGSHLVHDD